MVNASDESERTALQGLKVNLQELLLLTLETLKKKTDELISLQSQNTTSIPDDELALFYSELGQLNGSEKSKQDEEELRALQV